jgi:hypothetical protein
MQRKDDMAILWNSRTGTPQVPAAVQSARPVVQETGRSPDQLPASAEANRRSETFGAVDISISDFFGCSCAIFD